MHNMLVIHDECICMVPHEKEEAKLGTGESVHASSNPAAGKK